MCHVKVDTPQIHLEARLLIGVNRVFFQLLEKLLNLR
jgi:hypothetical protein